MLITDPKQLDMFHPRHWVWQGIPGIARTKDGRTFICLYTGNITEAYGNFAVVFKSDDSADFGAPIAVAKKDGKFRCFDPVLWIDPLNRLWFIWNVMPGEEVYASICENPDANELHWGKEFYIGRGVMMNKPTVLTSGEWLFPIALWKPELYSHLRDNTLLPNEQTGAYVYKTSDNGKTFIRLGYTDIRERSFDEHMVLELQNGVLMMLVRTNYGIGISYSYDRGKSWSAGERSSLNGPCSRFHICRLRSGRILLLNHLNFTGRNNLAAFLSEDDGKTFPYFLMLDQREQVAYPDATEGDDGYIYIVYDRERGCFQPTLEDAYGCAREIIIAKITEGDILKGNLVSEGSFLQNVALKLGKLPEGEPNPYKEISEDITFFVDQLLAKDVDAIQEIFIRYPVNCTDVANLDMKKLDQLIDQYYKKGKSRRLLLKIIELLRSAATTPSDPHPIIGRITDYINSHLDEDISMSTMAKDMNISVYYLSHLFKTVTGIGPAEYRNELRLTRAKQLLVSTDKPIYQIAMECGFSSASYFAEVFSQSEKISPSSFRKYHKN